MAMTHSDLFLKYFRSLQSLILTVRSKRIPEVKQAGISDCGAAALCMVLLHLGKNVSLHEISSFLGCGRGGTNAAELLRAARAFGCGGRGVSVQENDFTSLPPGAILHWGFDHFVVLERVDKKNADIIDPALGRRILPINVFRRHFTGVAIILDPGQRSGKRPANKGRLASILGEFLQHGHLIGTLLGVSLLIQILATVAPLMTGVVVDQVIPTANQSLLLGLAATYLLCQAISSFGGFTRDYLFIYLKTHVEVHFTLRFLDKLIDLPYSFFGVHTTGNLLTRLSVNRSIKEILTSTVLSSVLDGSMAVVYLVLLLATNISLALFVLAIAGIRVIILIAMLFKQRILVTQSLENQALSQTHQVELLGGLETLKIMGLEQQAVENWSHVFVTGLNIEIRKGRLEAVSRLLQKTLDVTTTLALLFYGAYLVLHGTWSLGAMLAFSALASAFIGPFGAVASAALQLQMLDVYLQLVDEVMCLPPEQEGEGLRSTKVRGAICVEEVSFKYSAEQPLVLKDISLAIRSGSTVALVGKTGSGKSTLARLLAGLYRPTTGRVLFDEHDLELLNRRAVRRQLGVVTQEAQIFGGSIRRNIALSDPAMSLEDVRHAASIACIDEEIETMPLGYDTVLSERGLSLSGGQRQRLAIARAIACKPAILILDEATSHLDAITEQAITANLEKLDCTRVVVAHRISTVRRADMIFVLEAGRLLELGTHEYLKARGILYPCLLSAQAEN